MSTNAKLTEDITVITDHVPQSDGSYLLTAPSAQLLTLARTLTDAAVIAIALNPRPDMEQLGRYGANRVLVPQLKDHSPRVPAVVADAAAACVSAHPGAALLCVSNYRGREVAAQLAIRSGAGAAVDATSISVTDAGELQATKSIFSGAWQTTFEAKRGTPVIAVRPSAIEAAAVDTAVAPEREDVAVEFRPQTEAVTVRSSQRQNTDGRAGLSDAQVVVCGGRGTDGDFTLVHKLAQALDGAVGATRVCADEGWVERSIQIGQTGVTVAPKLYVGMGVSGAIHHTCGMQLSQRIVAICDDPDAPIFELTDLGIVGDINQIVPRVLDQL